MGDRQGGAKFILRVRPNGFAGWKRAVGWAGFEQGMEFQYAPQSIRDSRGASWDDDIPSGADEGPSSYKKGTPREVSMQLLVNAYGQGTKARTQRISRTLVFPSTNIADRWQEMLTRREVRQVLEPFNVIESTVSWLDFAMKPEENTSKPPVLELIWRRFDPMNCVLTRRDIEYQMLDPEDMTPVRATIDITLREYVGDE